MRARALSQRQVLTLTLLVAFCSIVWELVLAQSLSAVMGGTFLRYNVTIGLFLASLGFGALMSGRFRKHNPLHLLADVELLLSAVGAICPLAILAWDAGLFHLSRAGYFDFRGSLHMLLTNFFNHGAIVLVGFLSGFELPLLITLAGTSREGGDSSALVLSMDYFGTLIGAVSFPLLLLPALGVQCTAALIGLLNALVGSWLLLRSRRPQALPRLAAFATLIFACAWMIVRRDRIDLVYIQRLFHTS